MELIITLRKTVENVEQGETIYQRVKNFLSDQPEVIITGMVNNHFVEPITGEPD